jgi:hypothetical protein
MKPIFLLTTDEVVEEIFDDGRSCMGCPAQYKETEPHGEVLRHCHVIDSRRYDECYGLQR